jgi:hypothetical protein
MRASRHPPPRLSPCEHQREPGRERAATDSVLEARPDSPAVRARTESLPPTALDQLRSVALRNSWSIELSYPQLACTAKFSVLLPTITSSSVTSHHARRLCGATDLSLPRCERETIPEAPRLAPVPGDAQTAGQDAQLRGGRHSRVRGAQSKVAFPRARSVREPKRAALPAPQGHPSVADLEAFQVGVARNPRVAEARPARTPWESSFKGCRSSGYITIRRHTEVRFAVAHCSDRNG